LRRLTGRGEAASSALQRMSETSPPSASIRHTVLVLSGKGGVGKSTVAANLAVELARRHRHVGLLDIDIHGPSIPRMLGLEDQSPELDQDVIVPVRRGEYLGVVSFGFFLAGSDQAIVWRGPMKMGAIRQLLHNVQWGELDYLIVDSPPGTGDEPLTVAQSVPDLTGALVITTPQAVALQDVRRSISFCRRLGVDVLGVVENMSSLICQHCGKETPIFPGAGAEAMASELRVPYLARLPLEPRVASASDDGQPVVESLPDSGTAQGLRRVAEVLLTLDVEDPEGAAR
jgi:ATP-binding protein involved in chromosome partitioning